MQNFESSSGRLTCVIGGALLFGIIGGTYLYKKTNFLSQLTDRRAKKKKYELCNICFAQLDTEDIKTCTPCCQCEKSVCRGKNCSYWLPKLAKWECQLCNLSNASQSRTKEWINKQVKTENEIYHPIRARSELNIPILDDKLSATQSLNYIPTCSTTSSTTGLNLHKEKIRNHVEEILADMLGGSLDNISVGPMSKNKQYYNLFNKYHKHLSEKLHMLENTMQQLNFNKTHYNYHNFNNNHNHHQCNHQYNNFNNGNHCQSLPYKDLPLWESNSTNNLDTNNPTNISHFKLKRLIERIVEETLRIPQLTDFSGVPPQLSSSDNHLQLQYQNYDRRQRHRNSSRRSSKLSHTDDYDNYNEMYGNNPQYFDPKRYQELLATAVLNKIVDTCATEKKSIDPNKIRNIDNNHNKIIITKELCDASSSSSSHDPRSDSSLPDPIQDDNVEDMNVRLYADILNENFDRESILSDSLSTHKNIPDIISSDNDSLEDFVSVASGADSTWEENWLFKKRKLATHPTGSIGMLVPAPREDIKTMIGDKSADEISDFSENEDDGYDNDNRNDSGPENDRIQNKTVIGGQNTVGLFDDLMEQTSLISKCSSSADNESFIETTNDYVDFKYGLNVKEEPSLDLTCGGVPIKTEAINAAIGVHLLKNEESNSQSESETNNNIEITEPSIFNQPSNIDSEVPEPNQQERNDNPNENQPQRRRSTIEFLAAIALGPVLTVCSPDINEDVLKTITNKTDVVSLLTQSENINIEIEEEQYFDIEVHNRPGIPCSPSIEATESGISTPNFKQSNSGYVTPESGISTPNLRQSRSGTPTNSGKVSPTSKQVRFNENPIVINKRKRNRTICDSELNASLLSESLIANVFVDHIIRAAENKKEENVNEEETFENNNLSDCMENVPSCKEEECTFILPSDVLTQISSLLSDIDLGSLKDDLIRSVSPIPFDNNLDIFICPPPPNFDIDVSATDTPSACDISLGNKTIINCENIVQEISVAVSEPEPIPTQNITTTKLSTIILENCNVVENTTTLVVELAEHHEHSKSIANTSFTVIKPETQPLEKVGNEEHIKDELTVLTENESVTAEISITHQENNKDIEETPHEAESSKNETIANTATEKTESNEQNEVNSKIMEDKLDLVEETEKPAAESLEHSQPVQDTPIVDIETKPSATQSEGNSKPVNDTTILDNETKPSAMQSEVNNKPVNDTPTTIVETESKAQEKILGKNEFITETATTVAETDILLLEETTPSAVIPLESNRPMENTTITNVKTEIQITIPIVNTELKEEILSTIVETQPQEVELLINSKLVHDIQTEIVTTETIPVALLENNKLINEALTAETETERLETETSENSKPVENASTENEAIEPLVVERFENNESIQEISTVIQGIESLPTKTLEGSSEENKTATVLANETASAIQVIEDNKLHEETLTAASNTELMSKESSKCNISVENLSTVAVEIETQDKDPVTNSNISLEVSISDTENQSLATEQSENSDSVQNETVRVVVIKPSDEKFTENSNSEENIRRTNSETETQIANSLEYSKFVQGALTAFASNSSTVAVEIETLDIIPVTNSNISLEVSISDTENHSLATDPSGNRDSVQNETVRVVVMKPSDEKFTENSNSEENIRRTNSETETQIADSLEYSKFVQGALTAFASTEFETKEFLANSIPVYLKQIPIVETETLSIELLKNNEDTEKTFIAVSKTEILIKECSEKNNFVENLGSVLSKIEEPVTDTLTTNAENKSLEIESLVSNNFMEKYTTTVIELNTSSKEAFAPVQDSTICDGKTVQDNTTLIVETESPAQKQPERSKIAEDSASAVFKTLDNSVLESVESVPTVTETEQFTEQPLKIIKSVETTALEVGKTEATVIGLLENNNITEEKLTAIKEIEIPVIEILKSENISTLILETEPATHESLANSEAEEQKPITIVQIVDGLVPDSLENTTHIQETSTTVLEAKEQTDSSKLENSKSAEDTLTKVEKSVESSENTKIIQETETIVAKSATESIEHSKLFENTTTVGLNMETQEKESLQNSNFKKEIIGTVVKTEATSTESYENNAPIEDKITSITAITENEEQNKKNDKHVEEKSDRVEETEKMVEEPLEHSEIVQDTAKADVETKIFATQSVNDTVTAIVETEPPAQEKNLEKDQLLTGTSTTITETDIFLLGETTPLAVKPSESNAPVEHSITSGENEIQEERATSIAPKENEPSTTTTLENKNLIEEISSKDEEIEQIVATPVVKTEEQIALLTAVPDDLNTKEVLLNSKQNSSPPVTEMQPPPIEILENNKTDKDTFTEIAETELAGPEILKNILITDEETVPSSTETRQIEKPSRETPSTNTEIESLSEGAAQISNTVNSMPTEIAETKPLIAELDCKNIDESSSTAISKSSSTNIKLSEVVELDDSFHFEMILPPPVEFQNITKDESPTPLNLLEEIEPITEILETVKDTYPAIVKHITEVSPTTAEFESTVSKITSLSESQLISNAGLSEPLENTNLDKALNDVKESKPAVIGTIVVSSSVENEQPTGIENETATKAELENCKTQKDTSTSETTFDSKVESQEMSIETEPTAVERTVKPDKKINSIEGLSGDTSTTTLKEEPAPKQITAKSICIEKTITAFEDIETPTKESLEIIKAVEEIASVITESISIESKPEITQSLENLEPPKDVQDTPTTVEEPESKTTQSMENRELSEDTQTAAAKGEPRSDKCQFKDEIQAIGNDIEAPAKESIEINKSLQEKMSIIEETDSLVKTSLELHDVPKDTLTEVTKSEISATTECSSSVKIEPTVVIGNETPTEQLLENNHTLKDISTVETSPQIVSSVKDTIAVSGNKVDTNVEVSEDTPAAPAKIELPVIEVLEKNKLIDKTTFENIEAPDTKSIEPSNPVEEITSNIAEPESQVTQPIANLEPPKDTSAVGIGRESAVKETLAIISSVKHEPLVVLGNVIQNPPTLETSSDVESSKIVSEVEQKPVSLIAVENAILGTNVGLSEKLPTTNECSARELLENSKGIEKIQIDVEAPATELLANSTSMEQTISFITEQESSITQLLENSEAPTNPPTEIIENTPAIIKSVSISGNTEATVVVENETLDKELLEKDITVNEIQNIETYLQVESLAIVEEIQNIVLDNTVGLSENTPNVFEKNKCKEEISAEVVNIEAPTKESLLINKSEEETTPIIEKSESISTQVSEKSEAPKAVSTSVIESKPVKSSTTQLLGNPEPPKDSPTDVIEGEPVNINSISISAENKSTVVETSVGDTLEKIKRKEEISVAVEDIEAPTKESLVINKSEEETTPIIAKSKSLSTQESEKSEAPTAVPTNVIENKPFESSNTQLLGKPEPPKDAPADVIEGKPVNTNSISISAENKSTGVIENETLVEEQLENKNTIIIEKPVELPEMIAERGSKDVETIALAIEKLDESLDILDSSPVEDMTTDTAKLESPTSIVEEVYTTPLESPKRISVECTEKEIIEMNSVAKKEVETKFEVSETPTNNKSLKNTTNTFTEPNPTISEVSENSRSVEHSESVSPLETKLEITKPLDSQSVEHTIIATAKIMLDSAENKESAKSSAEVIVTGESPILEPSDNNELIIETVATVIKTEPEIVENRQVVMEPTAVLDKNLDTIKEVEEILSSEEIAITDTIPTVPELSKTAEPLENLQNASAETESAVVQPDASTGNKLETLEINEHPTNISLNEIIVVNEQTDTISDVDLSKQITTTDSIDEIIITLPTAVENNIMNSDIENIELSDLIIPPPYDFAGEDTSETTQNDESNPIQASHNTSQIELINDFVENNSKILDTEITIINNNITTSSTNSETILSNDLAKNSDDNLENISKISDSSTKPLNPPTKAICDKESTQTVLETGHNINKIVEENSIKKEAVLTVMIDDKQSTQFSISTKSTLITESSNVQINAKNENQPNKKTLAETTNQDAAIQDKTIEVPSSCPFGTAKHPQVKLPLITNTTTSPAISKSNPDTNIVPDIEIKENEEISDNNNSDKKNKTDEMQETENAPETLAAIILSENSETIETSNILKENITSEEVSNADLMKPSLATIEIKNVEEISLDQQITTSVNNSIFELNETKSTEIKTEFDETSSAKQTIKELKSERTSSDSTDESTHTILDATEEAQSITLTDENLINNSATRTYLNGNENRIPLEESITKTLKTSTTTDTDSDDIVMLHDENILNMEINDSNLIDNKLNLATNYNNDVQNLTNNDNDVQNLTKNDDNVQNLTNISLENTNNTNINDNTNNNNMNTNINTNLNNETNFIKKIIIANPINETNFINKIIYFDEGNNDVLNNNNEVQNEIINELISEKIEPIMVTNPINITPKLIDTKNSEAFCKTLDISDEDDEQNNNNLIPGSIAEREHKKWYNAVEMPNNPYAPEALLRRLDSRPEVLLDMPQRHVSNTEISSPTEEEEEIITAVKLNPKKIDLSIYSRDYYVPTTTTTTKSNSSSKNKLTKMSCIENDQQLQQPQQESQQILNDNKELLNEEQMSISDEIVQIITNNEQSNEQPINDTCDNKLNSNSNPNSEIHNENIFSAKLIQINDMTDDEPTKSLLDLSITSASDKLKTDSSPSDISLANSLTLSEDSDTLRVYNLNKQETTFILKENQQQELQQPPLHLQLTYTSSTDRYFNDITNTPPNTPITPIIPKILPRAPRIRPTELKLQPQTSSQSPTNSGSGGKTAMVLTPQSFKFLHPKRKIIEPSQILTQEQYTTPPETPDKIVIEEEIVHTLPSVKALAKAFLLTQGRLSDVHSSNIRPKSLIIETTSDKFETKDQIIKTISHENLATPIQNVSSDTIKQDENPNNITITERPLSPVLLTTGKLKDNIAFFENLKKN